MNALLAWAQWLLSGLLFTGGLLLCGTGVLALFRFRNFSTRLLACSATDTAGLSLLLLGGMVLRGWDPATIKIGLILLICLLIHPLVTMELARCRQEQEE